MIILIHHQEIPDGVLPKEIAMESLEKLQSRFPFVENWEETGRFTRKGHRIVEGRFETSDEYWAPDAYGDDGNWHTTYGLVVITAIVDVKTNEVYTHNVETC